MWTRVCGRSLSGGWVRASCRWLRLLASASLLVSIGGLCSEGRAVDRGRELFVLCAACHGLQGQGDRSRAAPAIAGMPAWYVEAQLQKFLSGQRGYHPQDDAGLQMRPMAEAVRRGEDLRAIARYVASLPPVHPPATLDGNAAQGQTLYAPCTACHGADGRGNEGLKAPPLVGQSDWYIVEQIKKFKDGLRGADPRDATGAQMRAMANVLTDEKAMRDVAAFLRTLAH